ncbi:DNA mismatch repair endonuclease MutL [Methanocalculus taiwanensis]|uniref:DNA mismatch repair protein MutL n=1 Tax=Methanocalculus taiwanensis TaxID=106207 RepID=A0ABD4TG77_9EURY|nr:DNA mismatch repair endonuclease MutL [Methanocalculus taiwanensis]MCQ1537973.1 DNA mismatch repair endonuclease MutL [Methanocalculus taiwanensis]
MADPTIHLLDEETISHIAAGEVVERPASVVKELVENAIDAGATRIRVHIKSDSTEIRRITVIDDGRGMSPEDAPLAFRQHATSKIRTAGDLAEISTLGFRGEALASIAAVSEVTLTSRRREDVAGIKITLSGGLITDLSECAAPPGTMIEVGSLFFNTPARRKFLRTVSTELAHVFDLMERSALSHPEISFQLMHQEKEKFATSGRGDLPDTIQSLFGGDLARILITLSPLRGEMPVVGYVAYPLGSRTTRNQIYISVNGRQIASPSLVRAIRDGFGTSLAKGEYPFAVIDCRINPGEVDVNVHPTKREVKFSSERQVVDAVRTTVWSAVTEKGQEQQIIQAAIQRPLSGERDAAPQLTISQPVVSEGSATYGRSDRQLRQTALTGSPAPVPADATPVYRVLGQVDGTYIVATGADEELVIIDQHAAHEKIVFDQLQQRDGESSAFQHLLVPVIVSLSRKDAALVMDASEDLRSAGFVIEEFGGDTFAVQAVPAGPVKLDDPGEVTSLLLEVIEGIRGPAGERRMRVFKTIACRAAIKGNTRLSQEQMERLVHQLILAGPPYACPHGRPALVRFGSADLEHLFRRR